MSGCIDDDLMAAYFDGALAAGDVKGIDTHLSECAACRKDLSAMAVVHTLRERSTTSALTDDGDVIPGDRIGRYVLEQERARGAFGIVATAIDPELGRTIAIKLLQPHASDHLLRQEARAMAKLAHPNVVGVLDVGEHHGRVYLAMELVDGVDLRRWLALERRGWREVLRACVLAGRGLAAAHRAGLIHRDIKPDNILCGPDDRVRITDFGLAEGSLAAGSGVTGTPAYIAPEIWNHQPATERSDQWSFAATVYEALFGMLPFIGDTRDDVRAAIERGALTFPSRSPVPRRIRRLLGRSLARDPRERHVSVGALVDQLESVLRPRWPWLALGAGIVAAVASVAVVAQLGRAPSPCQAPASLIDRSWNPLALEAAFVATGRKHAVASAQRVASLFEDYSTQWLAARVEACTATRVRREQSEAILDARTRCLDRRRDELAALARALEDMPTPDAVDRAVEAARALSPLASCTSEAVAVDTAAPPPLAMAPLVANIDRELASVRAAALVDPHVRATVERARQLAAQARVLAYRPLLARATRMVAKFAPYADDNARADREINEALVAAAAAHDDVSVAEIWLDRLMFTSQTRGAPDQALALVPAAEAAFVRADAPAHLRAAFDHLHGAVLEMHGDHDAAVKILERARSEETDPLQRARMDIVLCSALLGIARFTDARDVCARGTADLERELTPDHPAVGFALMSVGNVALRLDDNETARVAFERSAKILESTVGHETVAYAFALMNLGLLAKRRGDVATARRNYERTIAILEPLHHAQLASALSNLAGIERSSGNYAAARAANVRAIAIATTSDGEQSARVAELTNDAGAIAFSAGEYDEAEASYKRALALATSLGADGTVSIADALGGLGLVAEERGDLRAAVSFYRRGIEADTQLYGAGDDTVARDLDNLGRCQLALGDGQAAATLTHALELYEARPMPNAFDVAHTQWDLARALSRHGTVPARALELARTARATFTRVTDAEAPVVLGQIDRWLAAHDKRRTGP